MWRINCHRHNYYSSITAAARVWPCAAHNGSQHISNGLYDSFSCRPPQQCLVVPPSAVEVKQVGMAARHHEHAAKRSVSQQYRHRQRGEVLTRGYEGSNKWLGPCVG